MKRLAADEGDREEMRIIRDQLAELAPRSPATAAILLEDRTSRAYGLRDLLRLIILSPLDLVLFRPMIVLARAKCTWRFLRRDTGWHKLERNARPARSLTA